MKRKGRGFFFFNTSVFAVLRVTEKSLKMSVGFSERVRDQAAYETKSEWVFSTHVSFQEDWIKLLNLESLIQNFRVYRANLMK